MTIVLLLVIGLASCLAVQLLVRRFWFGLFLSVVITLVAWIVASLLFAWAMSRPLVEPGPWSGVEAVLGAGLVAQVVARLLAWKRRIMDGP